MDIVLISVDSLRYDYMYDREGNVLPTLPTLARLAGEGTSFSNAFSNAAYTAESFRSILGGTYPWMFGSEPKGFQAERPHLAEELAKQGYTTAGFHSNPHLTPLFGFDRGFDYYLGREAKADETTFSRLQTAVRERVSPSSKVFDVLEWGYKTAGSKFGIQLGGTPYMPGEQLNDRVLQWVRNTPSTDERFIWVHYMDVHNPYYPHEGTVSEGIEKREAIRLFHKFTYPDATATAEELATLKTLYAGELAYLDRCLEELLAGLAATLDMEETLVVFMSDHGDAFDEHGFFYHPGEVLYDELVHVPLIVAGPGFEAPVSEVPVSNADVMPTLLAAAEAPIPDACVGTDLRELVESPIVDRQVFAHAQSQERGKAMVCTGEWKLVRDLSDGSEYLFNRTDDPDELENRIGDSVPGYPTLRRALDDHVEMSRAHDGETEMEIEVTEEVRAQLRRLGYQE